jgi:hypothetical protein
MTGQRITVRCLPVPHWSIRSADAASTTAGPAYPVGSCRLVETDGLSGQNDRRISTAGPFPSSQSNIAIRLMTPWRFGSALRLRVHGVAEYYLPTYPNVHPRMESGNEKAVEQEDHVNAANHSRRRRIRDQRWPPGELCARTSATSKRG